VPLSTPHSHEDDHPASTQPAAEEDEEGGETAIAEYDYEAQEENELSFPEGARITNIERVDDNWWAGEYQGNSGLFPCKHRRWGCADCSELCQSSVVCEGK
jgi:drebrin-like protein